MLYSLKDQVKNSFHGGKVITIIIKLGPTQSVGRQSGDPAPRLVRVFKLMDRLCV